MLRSGVLFVTFSLLPVLKAKDQFPCNLNSFKQPLPKLIFLGETHKTKEADVMLAEATEAAKGGKCLYGVEADYNDEPNFSKKMKAGLGEKYVDGVVGIDDPIAHSMATLMKAWDHPGEYKNALYGVFYATHNHKLLMSLWDQTKLQLTTPKEEATGALIDLLIKTDGKVSPVFFEDKATMRAIIEKWTIVLANYATKPENQEKYLPPPNLIKLVNDYFHGPVDNSVLFKGIWRDILMTRNIAAQYCRAATLGIELRISIGANHVPGVARLLSNLSNGQIPIVDKSHNQNHNFLPEPNLKLYWKHFNN